ncbi:MAG: FAD-dependent monooxygenase [Paracoccaceae bacterium]
MIDALPETLRKTAAFDGRAYALALASKRLLDRIGVWARVAGHSQPMLEIKASDGRAGEGPAPFFLHFDAAEIEEGPMGFMVEDRFLRRAFLDAMAEEPLITQVEDRVEAQAVDASGVTLTLASGKALRGRLLVGCDGRQSGTAARAGIRRTGWDYGQTALVCAIAHERPHHGTRISSSWPTGRWRSLPLPGNVSSIVWSETPRQRGRDPCAGRTPITWRCCARASAISRARSR